MNFLDKLTAQLPFGNKTSEPEYFFALIIGMSELTSVVWEIKGRELNILNKVTLPYKDEEDLIEKAFEALDKSVDVREIEPKKILFGVPDAWGVEDNLKEPYLKLLRKIVKETDLEPMAYVTTTNAVSFFLQKQEGVPPTAILLGLGDFVEVTLLRGGKTTETRSMKRSAHLFEDIEKLLREFTEVEVLPSKLLIYATRADEDLEKLRDDLMSYPWMSHLSFLHFPKIDLLGTDVPTEAVIWAAASEIKPDVSLKHSFTAVKDVEGQKKHTKILPSLKRASIKPVNEGGNEFGFVKGDIKEKMDEEESEEEVLPASRLPVPLSFGQFTAGIKLPFTKLPFNLSFKPHLKFGKWIFAPAVLIAVFAAYLFLARADVTIFVEPKVLERETSIVADPGADAIDENKKIIPGKVIEVTVTGSDKDTASGTKQIGDPSKGKVVIYNLTSSKVSFSQGAVLTSSTGLKFTLDSTVSIASQSSSTGADYQTVATPGKTDPVGLTASAIGPEGNLAAAAELTVANYPKSQVVGRVVDALSGGTSKNVTVVTADDQNKLKAKVINSLRQKAAEEMQGKTTDGRKIVADALAPVDGKYTFSKAVDDQAKEFTLNASVRFKGTSYLDSDLRTIVSKLITVDVPAGYAMNLQDAETQADVASTDSKTGKLNFTAKFRAKLLPKLNSEDIKNKIRGKGVEDATKDLKNLESVIGSEITIFPGLPSQISRLPLLSGNITINITPK